MAGFQLSGLASGFDWKSVVEQLISIERTPQNRMRANKGVNLNKLTSLSSLRTKVTALQTSVKTLSEGALLGKRSATLDDADSTWNASAASGSVAGEYTFNVTTLATRTQIVGATNRASKLNATNDVSSLVVANMRLSTAVTEGVFSVDGEQIEVDPADTLQEVFAKIATATGNAVTARYDATTDRVSLAGAGAITLGSSVDTSNFLYALKLYNNGTSAIRSAGDLGAIDLDESIAGAGLATTITAVNGSGAGSFEINGTTINYNVHDDSLQDIISRVNDSAAGVTLTYDSATDRFKFTNEKTGDLGMGVNESAGGLLAALGLTSGTAMTRGTNAALTVNGGGTIVSASNTFDAAVHGYKGISVTATSTGTQTVTVEADTKSLESGIRSFIEKFNDVQKFIDEQTKVTVNSDGSVSSAQFSRNRELSDMARSLRGMVFDQVAGLTGTVTRLEGLGIDFNGSSSQLTVRDGAKLTDALANNLDDVSAMFAKATTGITARMNTYLGRLTVTSGIIDTQENTLEAQNTSLDKQISDFERRLTSERTRLEEGFIRMEQAQSLINSQLSALQSTLNIPASKS